MKRARMTFPWTVRSEATRARARPCPVSPDALLALFKNADITVEQLCISTSALASLTTDLVARNNESVQLAQAEVASFRSALLARKTGVLGSVKRLSRKQRKRIVADFEAVDVSVEQLRVWADVAGAGAACPCVFVATPLLASPRQLQAPAIGSRLNFIVAHAFMGELGSVVTSDGLRVVSAAGPGLKWFEPHARNEFSVVLAQADGSVPFWLTTGESSGDVVVDVLPLVGSSTAAWARVTAAAVRSEWVRQGTVSVAYSGLSDDIPEAVLQLSVCGAPVANATGNGDWCVRVPRKPLAGHECAAVGTRVRALTVMKRGASGEARMAVSADEKWLVVGGSYTLSVYSLPGGVLVRSFGGYGDGPLQFHDLMRLCFAPNGNLTVVDRLNQRLQEVTLEGVFVRVIGVGKFGGGYPYCVAVHDDVIAVGCSNGTGPRVVLFDFGTCTVTSRFGQVGTAPGQLSDECTGIRFTLDGSHVIVAEADARRLSLFTIAGVFVRCVCVGVLGGGFNDVVQSVTGEYVVADYCKHRVCVFSPDGSELVRSWGVRGAGDGQFEYPTALAAAGKHLYVMDSLDWYVGRVQVFE